MEQKSLAASLGQAVGGGFNKALMDVLENIARNKSMSLGGRRPEESVQAQDQSTMQALNMMAQQPQQNLPQAAESLGPDSIENSLKSLQPKQEIEQQKIEQPKPAKKIATDNNKPGKLTREDKIASNQALKLIDKPAKLSPASKVADKIDENPDPIKHKAVEAKQDKKIKQLPKLSEKQQLAADKETKEYFDTTSKAYKGAKEGNIRLDRMIELIKGGNLNWPSLASFIDTVDKGIPIPFAGHIGIPLHFVESKDTHEFRKLSSDFIKGAKDIFGGRVTNLDLESFLKTIPNVSQSDDGKVAVIRNMRLFNSAALIRKKAMDEIINENGGERPKNLEQLVEERSSDQLDALADKFKKGILEQDELQALETSRGRKILGIF